MADLRRNESPGKFEGGLLIDMVVYEVSLNGCGETQGSEFGGESYTRVDGPITPDSDSEVELNDDERAYLASVAGAILYEDSCGFVSVHYYDTTDELDAAWDRVEASYASEDDDDSADDDTPDGWDVID